MGRMSLMFVAALLGMGVVSLFSWLRRKFKKEKFNGETI